MSVSVVIPTRNRGDTLGRAIVSAASQNPSEVLVIDDASTDDTPGIVEQLRGVYPCVRLHRHEQKSADWQEAAAAVYPSLVGTHVICMGADDQLALGVVDSVARHPSAAVVFHDYWCCRPDGSPAGAVSMGFQEPTALLPIAMQQRMLEYLHATETGIASGIGIDHLRWLAARKFWLMGPFSDAIGYAVVACLWGCVFVPGAGATFTIDDAGYGHQERSGERAAEYHHQVREFLRTSGLPPLIASAIARKRGIYA